MIAMRFVQAGAMLLGVVVYLGLVVALSLVRDGFEYSYVFFQLTFIGWNALLLVVTILVIIDSVRKVRTGRTRELASGVFIAKLAAIPFFLINYAIWALVGLMGAVILIHGIGIALVGAAAIAAVLTFLTMLSTSVYGWATIVRLRRERRIGRALGVLYTVLLFVFVADIVAGILLFAHSRRGRVAEAQHQRGHRCRERACENHVRGNERLGQAETRLRQADRNLHQLNGE